MTKKKYFSPLFLAVLLALASCSSNQNTTNEQPAEGEAAAESQEMEEIEEVPAVCIWDKISVRETADSNGKWVTALSVGESLTYLGIDSTNADKTYAKVLLNDGKEGWALKSFIVSDANSAVVRTDINLYSRPDLLTKSDKVFKMMDIVASIETQGDWMKIKGRRSGAKWIDEGWVKADNISLEAVDIATAKFANEALELEDDEEKMNALIDITSNSDLAGSVFITELELMLTEISGVDEVIESSEEMPQEPEDMEITEQEADSIQ